MSFAGHVLDAINRMNYNRMQLTARRDRLRDLKNLYIKTYNSHAIHLKNDDLPKEKLEQIRKEIRTSLRRKRIRNLSLSVSITLTILFILIYLFINYFHF